MVVINKPLKIDLETVGCIMTYNSKFILFYRTKDEKWGSLAGKIDPEDINSNHSMDREILEEIGLKELDPEYFKTTYHKYGNSNIQYEIFEKIFNENPLNKFKLKRDEIQEVGLFNLEDALQLDLFEDEDYCLTLYNKEKMK